jgi:hypothetical protein
MVVTRWTEATEAFWEPTLRKLAEQRRTLIVGAGLPIGNTRDYRNALVVAGAEKQQFFQRIPLPWVMWNPIATKDRVPLRLRGPAILTVAGERAAPLICYEQLIPWPILTAALDRPSVVLATTRRFRSSRNRASCSGAAYFEFPFCPQQTGRSRRPERIKGTHVRRTP